VIGEIDLSIGYVSGMAGVTVAYFQMPGTSHQYSGLIAIALALIVGTLIGLLQGSFVALIGVPSFVVTLAGLFVWQGVIITWIGGQGVIGIQDSLVNDTANYFLPKTAGWIAAVTIAVGFAAVSSSGVVSRVRAGLPIGSVTVLAIRVWPRCVDHLSCRHNRQSRPRCSPGRAPDRRDARLVDVRRATHDVRASRLCRSVATRRPRSGRVSTCRSSASASS